MFFPSDDEHTRGIDGGDIKIEPNFTDSGYFAYKDYYLKCEEVATGEGYADMVYIPKPGKGVPMLLVELKWNKDADTAISQIKEKGYARGLKDFGSEILLVGISYDKDSKVYECQIENWQRA